MFPPSRRKLTPNSRRPYTEAAGLYYLWIPKITYYAESKAAACRARDAQASGTSQTP